MNFSKKIFISVFVTTLVLGSLLVWASHSYVSRQAKEAYISRYSVFSRVMGDTLTRLDTSTEALMLNAVKVISERDSLKGVLSTGSLKKMRDELSVTHIFILDKNGKFIRSTNEDPKLIPNVFSFCPAYSKLVTGGSSVESTPIIQPQPEPKPYKFLYIPNFNQTRIIEVGLRVDFVAKTLGEAVGADPNIISMSLFSPDGNTFARFNSESFQFKKGVEPLPATFPAVVESGDMFHIFTKVISSHPKCCQCDISRTSRNGEYYYILESEVSKKELNTLLATTKSIFLLLALANLALAFILSRFLSRRLVKNIEAAVKKIRSIKEEGNLEKRLDIKGDDEVAYLTNEFDRLLDSVEESHHKNIETEKIQTKVQLAKEVAHNMRSPVLALEMMMPMLSKLPVKIQKVFFDSARDIKNLSERLTRQADSLTGNVSQLINVPVVVEDLVQQKRIEFSGTEDVVIEFHGTNSIDIFAFLDPTEFNAVVSNLINNAIESYPHKNGRIQVSCGAKDAECFVIVRDNGGGIPQEFIDKLGTRSMTVGKDRGRGVGLYHAYRTANMWGGKVNIQSSMGMGTMVTLMLPRYLAKNSVGKRKVQDFNPTAN